MFSLFTRRTWMINQIFYRMNHENIINPNVNRFNLKRQIFGCGDADNDRSNEKGINEKTKKACTVRSYILSEKNLSPRYTNHSTRNWHLHYFLIRPFETYMIIASFCQKLSMWPRTHLEPQWNLSLRHPNIYSVLCLSRTLPVPTALI